MIPGTDPSAHGRMVTQVQVARACAVLSLFISAAILLSVFGPQRELAAAQGNLALHEKLLGEAREVLAQNERELTATRTALEKTR